MVEKIEGRLAFSEGRGYDEDMRKNHLQNLLQNRVPPLAAEREGKIMRALRWLKAAAAAAAVMLCVLPLKADAAELIQSPVYGQVYVMDENGVNGLMFTQESDAITQFMRETASDPYFVRYNRFDNVLAKLKATATSSIVLDENGNVVSVKDAATLAQETAAHLNNVAAMDAMSEEEKLALENQQLAQLNEQAVMVAAMAQQAALLKQLAASSASPEEAAVLQTYVDMCAQLQALIAAKQQVVLLYQQQADPAVCQQALLNVQNLAAAVQQSTAQLALYES